MTRLHVLAIACALVSVVGCAHRPEAKAETASSNMNQRATADSNGRVAETRPAPAPVVDNADCGTVRVHFELNAVDLSDRDKATLERSARCLENDRNLHVTVEGNADERGTEEYNLALGDHRATAVAGYLRSLGASETQLKTVSYGKENPLCTEHDEACWAKNRRAAIKPETVATSSKKRR